MKRRTKRIIPLFLVLTFLFISIFGFTSFSNAAGERQINANVYYDKVRGSLLAQLVGNFTGLPWEFSFIETVCPLDINEDIYRVVNPWETDDDTSMEWTFLHMMETYGFDKVTYKQMSVEWIDHFKDKIWNSNLYARENMIKGILAPESGSKAKNSYALDIGAQIQCEIFGQMAPGMMNNAITREDYWGRVTNDDYAVDTAKFYSGLFAEAFFESDTAALINKVKAKFPTDSLVYKMVTDVQNWCSQNANWEVTRGLIKNSAYKENVPYLAKLNFCSTLMALIYGKGDMKKTINMAVMAGWDNDCNAATAGAIVGIIKGYSGLPQIFKDATDVYKNTNRAGLPDDTITNIASRIQKIAEKNIVARGGTVTGTGANKKYTIVDGDFIPPSQTDQPTPPQRDYSSVISWAQIAVKGINDNDLSGDELFSNYNQSITRGEFSSLVVRLFEKGTGANMSVVTDKPFTDITGNKYEQDILKAYKLGIVLGKGNNLFKPNELITRQEMSVMLFREIKVLYPDGNYTVVKDINFVDKATIAAWAIDAVTYNYKNNIMLGVGTLKIGPLNNVTREMSMTLIYRLALNKGIIK